MRSGSRRSFRVSPHTWGIARRRPTEAVSRRFRRWLSYLVRCELLARCRATPAGLCCQNPGKRTAATVHRGAVIAQFWTAQSETELACPVSCTPVPAGLAGFSWTDTPPRGLMAPRLPSLGRAGAFGRCGTSLACRTAVRASFLLPFLSTATLAVMAQEMRSPRRTHPDSPGATIRAATDLVLVPVTVFGNSGQPVFGLERRDLL